MRVGTSPDMELGHRIQTVRLGEPLLEPLVAGGGGVFIELPESGTTVLHDAYRASEAFFLMSVAQKMRYCMPGDTPKNDGYRPFDYSQANAEEFPDHRDHNDSFIARWERFHNIPNHKEIDWFLRPYEALYRLLNEPVVQAWEEVACFFQARSELDIIAGSVLQINSFERLTAEELYQTRHGDLTMFSTLWADQPGLERVRVLADGRQVVSPVLCKPNQILLTTHEVADKMTGGLLETFLHQVRNRGLSYRKSLTGFYCPEPSDPIAPYVEDPQNPNFDVAKFIREQTDKRFGLKNFHGAAV